jgi:signal transduction histidine kinase
LKYHEKYVAIKESILKEENLNQLNEYQVKYETAEKELEIERQKVEISHQKTKQYVLSGGLLFAGALLVMLVYIIMLRTRRNRELSESNATKDKFFSIISHDLKNPAIAQRDAIQLLFDYSGQWDAASLTNYYGKLLKSANGQVDLLYTLLGWAQLQTGRMPFHPAQFDLVAIMQPSIALIRNMADGKGVEFAVRMPETAIVTCDKNMLTTVVRNLLTNAVKFTPKGGTATLTISPPSPTSPVSPASPTKHVISITDTGTGMTSEQIKNLFQLDRQHSRPGTAGEQGSGLGLIVCRELLQKHGSALHVESEEGKGSCFRFEI